MTFDDAVAEFPAWAINQSAPNVDYTPWHLLEHLRITQVDMLSYMRDGSGYIEIEWPADYWPDKQAETLKRLNEEYEDTVRRFGTELPERLERQAREIRGALGA